jgi:hypothetical protein
VSPGLGDCLVTAIGFRLQSVVGGLRALDLILRPGDAERAGMHQAIGGQDQTLCRQRGYHHAKEDCTDCDHLSFGIDIAVGTRRASTAAIAPTIEASQIEPPCSVAIDTAVKAQTEITQTSTRMVTTRRKIIARLVVSWPL